MEEARSGEALGALVEELAGRDWRRIAEVEQMLLAAGAAGRNAVLAGMTHPRPRVRRACAGFMDHHGDDRCASALAERVREDAVPRVRREAVHSLSCQRCKVSPLTGDAVPLLIAVAQNDSNLKVRREAVFGLGQRAPDERVIPILRAVLENETDPLLRKAAHAALKHHDPAYREECAAKARAAQRRLY